MSCTIDDNEKALEDLKTALMYAQTEIEYRKQTTVTGHEYVVEVPMEENNTTGIENMKSIVHANRAINNIISLTQSIQHDYQRLYKQLHSKRTKDAKRSQKIFQNNVPVVLDMHSSIGNKKLDTVSSSSGSGNISLPLTSIYKGEEDEDESLDRNNVSLEDILKNMQDMEVCIKNYELEGNLTDMNKMQARLDRTRKLLETHQTANSNKNANAVKLNMNAQVKEKEYSGVKDVDFFHPTKEMIEDAQRLHQLDLNDRK